MRASRRASQSGYRENHSTEARVFEITSPTKKISLNYPLNKVSQFNYYI